MTAGIGPAWGTTIHDGDSTLVTNAESGAGRVSVRYGSSMALIYQPDFGAAALNVDLRKLAAARSTVTVRALEPVSGAETMVGSIGTERGISMASPGPDARGDSDRLFVIA